MSGFNPQVVKAAFLADGRRKANVFVNLGYGDPSGDRPRGLRLSFAEAAKVLWAERRGIGAGITTPHQFRFMRRANVPKRGSPRSGS